MERRSNLNLHDYKIHFSPLVAIQHLLRPLTHTPGPQHVAQEVERPPPLRSSRRTWPMPPSYHSVESEKPSHAQQLGFWCTSCVCYLVVAGHAHCHLTPPQSISICHCGPFSCHVMPCHDMPHHSMPCRSLAENSCHVVSREILPVAL